MSAEEVDEQRASEEADDDADERRLGMEAGKAWTPHVDVVVVYQDLGISSGMQWGISAAQALGKTIEYRSLTEWAKVLKEDT